MIAETWLPPLVGLAVGSSLMVVVARYPALAGFALGRSVCPACRSPLAPRDLVPVVSWIMLRGRCRACTAPIAWHYPAVELAGAAVALWAATVFSGWLLWVSCGLGWTILALALIDLRSYRLPDFLTLPLLVAGLAVTFCAWPAALLDHALGAALGYGALAAIAGLYRALRGRDGLGLGDAKLLAAAGAWLSWQLLPELVLTAALLALASALAARLWRGVPLAAASRLPFGPYLGLAIWLFWLYAPVDILF